MLDLTALVHPEEALVVLGALNAHPRDRRLDRSEVRPVQVVFAEGVRPVPFFDSWGQFGISSVSWRPERPEVLYFTTDCDTETGDELLKVDLREKRTTKLPVAELSDVHETAAVDGTLWISNTATDEAVAFDLDRGRVTRRVRLSVRGATPEVTIHAEDDGYRPEAADKFHCNQVFEGLDGNLYVLVHYAAGRQLVRRAANKLVKRQGNGGVINLSTGRNVPLDLRQPHSVRVVGESYWVFDSGRFTINVYDAGWTLREKISSEGWGRGAGVSRRLGLFYAGVSAIRERYLDMVPNSQRSPNMVLPISIESGKPVGRVPLANLEQVNEVHVIQRRIALALIELQTPTAGHDPAFEDKPPYAL